MMFALGMKGKGRLCISFLTYSYTSINVSGFELPFRKEWDF